MYVTTAICKQAVRPGSEIVLGNVNSFRDWSHVKDIARGYVALSEHGTAGRVYIQGSGKMYSVLTFALKALEDIEGQTVEGIETLDGEYLFDNPLETVYIRNSQWSQNKLDDAMISCAMRGEELFPIERYGISVVFNGPVNRRNIVFSPDKWRRIDVPMLLAASNMHEVGIRPSERAPLPELIHDMNNYELGVHC
jgi:GDPmannose 4,6-dehydratase